MHMRRLPLRMSGFWRSCFVIERMMASVRFMPLSAARVPRPLLAAKTALDPLRIATAVEHGPHVCGVPAHFVVDREGERPPEQAMQAVNSAVSPRVEREGIDVGKERIQEIRAEPLLLFFVEGETLGQVCLRRGKNPDLHRWRSRS